MAGILAVTLQDGFARTTTKRFEMTEQILLADYVANANLLLAALDDIVDLEILKATMNIDDGLVIPSADPTGSNVDVGATFSAFVSGGDGKKASHKVPGITMSFVGPLGVIDVTDATIFAYLDLFGDPPDGKFRISDGEYVVEWIVGTLDK